MKILIFEYITGGGFNKQDLPESLAHEGHLMLQALLDNLHRLNGHELTLMLDSRFEHLINTDRINTVLINAEHDCLIEFAKLMQHCDAVWPVAPEFDHLLETLCQTAQDQNKILLSSPAPAVAITANKFSTFLQLMRHGIDTVPTYRLDMVRALKPGVNEWIAKPIDGAGCSDSYLFNKLEELVALNLNKNRYIIQPHLQGKKTSLSCLFKHSQGWMITANLQHFEIIDQQYVLKAITVNIAPGNQNYQNLVAQLALAFPALWGYVGIDLIETEQEILVLEINPRLTSSFAGIKAATGVNVAQNVLQLLDGNPDLQTTCDHEITVNLS